MTILAGSDVRIPQCIDDLLGEVVDFAFWRENDSDERSDVDPGMMHKKKGGVKVWSVKMLLLLLVGVAMGSQL